MCNMQALVDMINTYIHALFSNILSSKHDSKTEIRIICCNHAYKYPAQEDYLRWVQQKEPACCSTKWSAKTDFVWAMRVSLQNLKQPKLSILFMSNCGQVQTYLRNAWTPQQLYVWLYVRNEDNDNKLFYILNFGDFNTCQMLYMASGN
jgi:hypothetical protein